jgi:hypothetical protein
VRFPPAGDSRLGPVRHNERDAPWPPKPRTRGLSHPIRRPWMSSALTPPAPKGGAHMIKWNYPALRVVLALGAIASFAIASGAGMRWS